MGATLTLWNNKTYSQYQNQDFPGTSELLQLVQSQGMLFYAGVSYTHITCYYGQNSLHLYYLLPLNRILTIVLGNKKEKKKQKKINN